jgi:transposase
MIPVPSDARVRVVTGRTDMRRGMHGLALTVQESLKRDPHAASISSAGVGRARQDSLA